MTHKTDQPIAIFIQSLKAGGAERSTLNLANALAATGIRVDLIMMDETGVFAHQVSPLVKTVKLKKSSIFKAIWSLRHQWRDIVYLLRLSILPGSPKPYTAIPELIRYIREEKPGVVLSVLDYGNIATIVAAAASGIKTRTIIGQRNHFSREYVGRAQWRRDQVIPTIRYFYKRADAIVSVSKGVAQDLCESLNIPPERVYAIYNAVTNDLLKRQMEEELDHPWFSDKQIPVILAAGKLKPQKDFQTLLRAFAKVCEQKKARLIILGEGALRRELTILAQQLNIAENVSFEGFVENPFKFMRRSDLFVLSSRHEGLPGVLIQAIACGCPVVSTDCPSGPAEILENGKFGELVPVGDADKLADVIIRNLDIHHDRQALTERGNFFSEKTAIKNYLSVIFPDFHNAEQ